MNRAEPSPVNEWNASGIIGERKSDYTWASDPQGATEIPNAIPKTAEANSTGEGDIASGENSIPQNQES